MKTLTVVAQFKGKDPRLKTGKVYNLTVQGIPAKYCHIEIPGSKEKILVSYESVGAFLRNWDKISVFHLTQSQIKLYGNG